MAEIIPAIMPKKWQDIQWHAAQVEGLAKIVQLDIMDGIFVKNVSWPYGSDDKESFDRVLNEEEGMPLWERVDYELDLMVENADQQFESFMKLAPKRIIFHFEATPNLKHFLEHLDTYFKEHIEFGVAVNTTTDISLLDDIIPHVRFVQCMGIERIGYQGQPFDERVLDQISRLRQTHPALTISVDGAVNEDTAADLIDAGASRLVIGSAIFKSGDIREAILEFKSL